MKKILFAAIFIVSTAHAQELRLSLEQCRDLALQNNSSVVTASLDLKAAEYQRKEALSEYFPRVSLVGFGFWALDPLIEIGIKDVLGDNDLSDRLQSIIESYATQYGIDPYYSTLKRGYLAGISLSQPIYAGGRIIKGNRLAKLGVEVARLQARLSQKETLSQIEGYFWELSSLQEKQKSLEVLLNFVDTLYRDVNVAYKNGLVKEDELLQVTLSRNRLMASQIQLKNGIRLSKMNLLNSIGLDYTVLSSNASEERPHIDSVFLEEESAVPLAPEHYYVDEESIAAEMDESRLLDLSVEAAGLQKKISLGEALPQVAVGASYSFSDFMEKSNSNGLVFATVQIPISEWGKTSARQKRMQTQIDKAEVQRDFLQSQLLLSVRKSWVELNSLWDQYQISISSEEAARASFERVRTNYEAGMIALQELLESETRLRQSCEERIDALNSYRQALSSWLDLSRSE